MARETDLVGAWPGLSGASAMDRAFTLLGDDLLLLGDGETRERAQWLSPTLDWLRANPKLALVTDGSGSYTEYEDGQRHVVGDGHTVAPPGLELNYRPAFGRSYDIASRSCEGHSRDDQRLRVRAP